MLRATKIRIYPTPEQAAFLNAQFGAVRFAYNKALHIKKHAYQRHGVNLSPRNDLKPLLSVAKKSRKYAWLKEFDSMALQQAVINIDVAFSNFFNPKLKARFPTFKRKHGKQSSYHCVGIKVLDNAIKIPKLAPIEARLHRELHGKLKSITVTRSATGKYYALMNPLMILVKIIKLRWIHILSYDQMVSRKINNQTTRCANSIFYTTLFTNSAPNYT
ncbi:RNA-guided endonuclease InsQ/TnpB family protein [Salmonella enterica]|uniref:RNA-guided endonuclease InsQ/TnpB family protein n=1 Tax=Salmonella enterica TaxID=28901 RepID=UPI001FD2E10E|nr:RNA-guided endonuclease TnpB family protein [Salmonella enterica]